MLPRVREVGSDMPRIELKSQSIYQKKSHKNQFINKDILAIKDSFKHQVVKLLNCHFDIK
uniref:Uncharacterized protein n=1 Tax=Arundo donax TaxID=35708 RepID=A0A0A9FJG4_ARUDO